MKFDLGSFYGRALFPASKNLTEFGFHGGGIEVASDPQNDVVGMNVGLMPVDEVLACDRGHGRVLGFASVRIVGAVGQLEGFAAGNFADVVVAAGNGVVHSLLCEI